MPGTRPRTLLFCTAMFLVLAAPPALAAGGINLAWGDCGAYGLAQKNFACRSMGLPPNVIVASVVTPAPMNRLVAVEGVMDIQTDQPTLSRWWSMEGGGCRSSAISCNFSFVAGPFSCSDPWQGNAYGAMNYQYQYGGPNHARIRTVGAVASGVTSDGVSEYYMFSIVITGAKSDGPGTCDGCANGACIVLNSIQVEQPKDANADYLVTNPLLRNYVLWQGGTGAAIGSCPAAIPVQNATWGTVKSLYHGK
jgi:hypothetical protein